MATQLNPYPEGSIFAVHKGFKPGVYRTFREFRSQTEGFPKKIFAVFSDENHAEVFVQTGKLPPGVEPLLPNEPAGRLPDDLAVPVARPSFTTTAPKPTKIVTSTSGDTTFTSSSTLTFSTVPAPLPTPSASPDRSIATPFVSASQPIRLPTYNNSPKRPYASQPVRSNPPPVTPRKSINAEDGAEIDQGGDTEPEEDDRAFAPIAHTRVLPTTPAQVSHSGAPARQTQSAITPGTKPLSRSIADVLRREMSSGAVFPQVTTDTPGPTSGITVSSAGSPSKPVTRFPGKHTATNTNPHTLSTPDLTPAPRSSHKRTRECMNCGGTGRVPCSDEESDSSQGNAKVVRRSSGSPTLERRAKRSSDGKRTEGRDAKLKARVDKGKGKARATNEVMTEPSTPLGHTYL
ncbi:hypothetical protein FRC06_002262 [Ceratobasidium sp. 370]|nr:hypothetical protein FRC06_002262 [Ceratobasidium sp. 370]